MSNISISDFNDHFMTHIRGFETNHTDETGTYDYGVGFNVVCKDNNRVMYFEAHLLSNVLPVSYTDNDVVQVAWSNVLPDVKNWSSSVISSSNILGYNFTPSVATDSNLDFQTIDSYNYATYSNDYNTTVSRMETYPANNPSCWCVGFSAVSKNDSTTFMTIDTQVVVNTFEVYRAEQEILDLGWSNLKENIGAWAKIKSSQSQYINTAFTNSNW
jgi:hypothetical protein